MTDSTSGANAADIMMKFESLGADCVFGYVQRSVGAEPLGLLRWACMPFPRLLEALDNKFKGLGVPENIEIEASDEVHATLGDREYTATDRSYDMWAHTFVPVSPDADLAAVALDVGRRSRFLSRGLLDELEIGEKIFIYKDAANALTDADRAALLARIRRFGESKLLYVGTAEPGTATGLLRQEPDGLFIAALPTAYMTALHVQENRPWVELCADVLDRVGAPS